MTLQQLLILAAAAMCVVLAVTRVVRARNGRAPHPEGRARPLFVLAFLFLPPIVIEALVLRPATSAQQLHILESELVYLGSLALFTFLMGVAALFVRQFAPGRSRPLLMLALVGSQLDPNDVQVDPALTPALAESVAVVDDANAVFPRGPDFATQIDRPGFRSDWDALQTATADLEGRIADDHRLGLPVSSRATAVAQDARSRLDTLRRLALDEGRAWAS